MIGGGGNKLCIVCKSPRDTYQRWATLDVWTIEQKLLICTSSICKKLVQVVWNVSSGHSAGGSIYASRGCGGSYPRVSLVNTSATSLTVSVTKQKNSDDSVHPIWREEGITSLMQALGTSGARKQNLNTGDAPESFSKNRP